MAKVTWQVEGQVEGGVRSVLLNRPDKRNALDAEMIAQLQAAFTEPPGAGERVAVIRAAGPVFCAGLDLKERSARPGPVQDLRQAGHRKPRPHRLQHVTPGSRHDPLNSQN